MDRTTEQKTQDLLESVTSSIHRGENIERAELQSSLPGAEAEGLVSIISDLESTLLPVEPRAEFADQLRSQLLDEQLGVIDRMLKMPARVHIAAILAVMAGFVLLWTRKLSGTTTRQDITEEPVAAPL